MKKTILVFFILINYISPKAQEISNFLVEKNLTPITKEKTKTFLSFTTKDNNGGVFIGREYEKGYFLEHYDKDLKLLKKYDLKLYKYKQSTNVIGAFMIDNKLCLIERFNNFKNKSIDYNAHVSEMSDFNFVKTNLLSIPIKKLKYANSIFHTKSENGFKEFQLSKNQKYFTLSLDIVNRKQKEIQFYTFDSQLKKVYQSNFIRDIKDRKFLIQNITINENDGSLYFLAKAYTKNKKKKKTGGKYQYEIYKLDKEINKKLIIDAKEKYIASLKIIQNKNKLICVGFFSKKGDSYFRGVAFFDIDKNTFTVQKQSYTSFTNQFFIDKYGENKKRFLKHLEIKNIFFTEKNDIIINAEEFNSNSTESIALAAAFGMIGTAIASSQPVYLDIISVKLNGKGDVIWARNINREQLGGISNFYSYQSVYVNNVNYFVLNVTGLKRLDRNRIKFITSINKKPELYLLSIDNTKKIKYQKLYSKTDIDSWFNIYSAIIDNDGKSIILQGKKRTKKRLLKLSFK